MFYSLGCWSLVLFGANWTHTWAFLGLIWVVGRRFGGEHGGLDLAAWCGGFGGVGRACLAVLSFGFRRRRCLPLLPGLVDDRTLDPCDSPGPANAQGRHCQAVVALFSVLDWWKRHFPACSDTGCPSAPPLTHTAYLRPSSSPGMAPAV